MKLDKRGKRLEPIDYFFLKIDRQVNRNWKRRIERAWKRVEKKATTTRTKAMTTRTNGTMKRILESLAGGFIGSVFFILSLGLLFGLPLYIADRFEFEEAGFPFVVLWAMFCIISAGFYFDSLAKKKRRKP